MQNWYSVGWNPSILRSRAFSASLVDSLPLVTDTPDTITSAVTAQNKVVPLSQVQRLPPSEINSLKQGRYTLNQPYFQLLDSLRQANSTIKAKEGQQLISDTSEN